MKKINKQMFCVSCGKRDLTNDEVGINKKLLGDKIETFFCMECLADYLEVSVEDIKAKIEEFKEEGCVLFK